MRKVKLNTNLIPIFEASKIRFSLRVICLSLMIAIVISTIAPASVEAKAKTKATEEELPYPMAYEFSTSYYDYIGPYAYNKYEDGAVYVQKGKKLTLYTKISTDSIDEHAMLNKKIKKITYKSSDTAIATVATSCKNSRIVKVSGLKTGTAKITVTFYLTSGKKIKDTINVNVLSKSEVAAFQEKKRHEYYMRLHEIDKFIALLEKKKVIRDDMTQLEFFNSVRDYLAANSIVDERGDLIEFEYDEYGISYAFVNGTRVFYNGISDIVDGKHYILGFATARAALKEFFIEYGFETCTLRTDEKNRISVMIDGQKYTINFSSFDTIISIR